jgi:hypothetical protein
MKRFGWLGAVVVALGGAAVVSLGAQSAPSAERIRQQLIGSYRLVSYVSYDQKGDATKLPYSIGQISYDAAGRMSAQLMRDDRPRFTPGTPPSEAERAAAYSGFISYFGRYTIDADKGIVTHHVEGAMSPNMVGQAMPRWYEFSADGASLFLHTKNGDRVTGRLQWDRYK